MFILPDLPYPYEALEPAISADTLHFHHDKHHKKYVDTTNKLLDGQPKATLEEVVKSAQGKLLDNAAQAWNHGFFWECMSPDREPAPEHFAKLRETFVKEGEAHFGSGWVWIVFEAGELKVVSTHDADTPLRHGQAPLIVCDLWEHAYYLDYQNDRKGFLEAWFDQCADWRFAQKQLRAAKGDGQPYRYPAPKESLEATPTEDDEKSPRPARPGDADRVSP